MTLDVLGESSREQGKEVLPAQQFLWGESGYLTPGVVDESAMSGYGQEFGHQLAGPTQALCTGLQLGNNLQGVMCRHLARFQS